MLGLGEEVVTKVKFIEEVVADLKANLQNSEEDVDTRCLASGWYGINFKMNAWASGIDVPGRCHAMMKQIPWSGMKMKVSAAANTSIEASHIKH